MDLYKTVAGFFVRGSDEKDTVPTMAGVPTVDPNKTLVVEKPATYIKAPKAPDKRDRIIKRLDVFQLMQCLPMPEERAKKYLSSLNVAIEKYSINTAKRLAAFLAVIGDESQNLECMTDPMNYSAQALAERWPQMYADRFSKANNNAITPNGLAKSISGTAQPIANVTYADKLGNGGPSSNDGWKFRPRGPMKVVGRAFYTHFAQHLGVDVVTNPDLLTEPSYGMLAAGAFWASYGMNFYLAHDQFEQLCLAIEDIKGAGAVKDVIGLEIKLESYQRCLEILTK
jgi:putative chitinase